MINIDNTGRYFQRCRTIGNVFTTPAHRCRRRVMFTQYVIFRMRACGPGNRRFLHFRTGFRFVQPALFESEIRFTTAKKRQHQLLLQVQVPVDQRILIRLFVFVDNLCRRIRSRARCEIPVARQRGRLFTRVARQRRRFCPCFSARVRARVLLVVPIFHPRQRCELVSTTFYCTRSCLGLTMICTIDIVYTRIGLVVRATVGDIVTRYTTRYNAVFRFIRTRLPVIITIVNIPGLVIRFTIYIGEMRTTIRAQIGGEVTIICSCSSSDHCATVTRRRERTGHSVQWSTIFSPSTMRIVDHIHAARIWFAHPSFDNISSLT
uniref:Uncharacterized protein n=1 Tax=Cacopsylla melanoneura TaxID=428564 RepID=A0A8D9AK40_9HEMI